MLKAGTSQGDSEKSQLLSDKCGVILPWFTSGIHNARVSRNSGHFFVFNSNFSKIKVKCSFL